MKYYAGYRLNGTDVAIFNSEKERDAWVQNEDIFPRCAFTEKDVLRILGNPKKAESVSDLIEDNLSWLVNPHNFVADGVTYTSFEVLVTV